MSCINLIFIRNEILLNFAIRTILLAVAFPFIHKLITNYIFSINVIIICLITHVSYLITNTNGIHSPFIFWFIVPILISSVFFRTKIIAYWSFVIFGICIYLLYQDIFGKNIIALSNKENVCNPHFK